MKLNGQNLVIAFLAASTLGLGVQLYHTRQQLEDARKAPTLQIKRSDIQVAAAPAALSSPAVAPSPTEATVPSDIASPETEARPPGGPGGPGGGRDRGGARFAAQMTELMKDPEFAAAWKLEQEARLEQRYGAFFKQLNLPADQLAALKNLMIERENAGRDVWTSAAAQGMNPRESRDQLRQLTADLQTEVDNNIKATFGESLLNSLNAFNASGPQRATVNDISQRLSYAGQPLNDSQSQQLARIIADTGTVSGRSVAITDDTIARAQAVLAPVQVNALKAMQAEQAARQVIGEKMRQAREQAMSNRSRD
jgi:hypothetical protein